MATSIVHRLTPLWSLILLFVSVELYAQDMPPPAYQLAAKNAGVPSEVLYAVALTESGVNINNKIRPWPWTLNVAGKGRLFKSQEDACSTLLELLKTVPAKRIDVGIAQINYGYHAKRVTGPCELLDPYQNLLIAADLLKTHYRQGEDWLDAIGRYHSPTNTQQATRYRILANRHLLRITANNKDIK